MAFNPAFISARRLSILSLRVYTLTHYDYIYRIELEYDGVPDEGVELQILQVIYFTLVRKHAECKESLRIEDILLSGACVSHRYLKN